MAIPAPVPRITRFEKIGYGMSSTGASPITTHRTRPPAAATSGSL